MRSRSLAVFATVLLTFLFSTPLAVTALPSDVELALCKTFKPMCEKVCNEHNKSNKHHESIEHHCAPYKCKCGAEDITKAILKLIANSKVKTSSRPAVINFQDDNLKMLILDHHLSFVNGKAIYSNSTTKPANVDYFKTGTAVLKNPKMTVPLGYVVEAVTKKCFALRKVGNYYDEATIVLAMCDKSPDQNAWTVYNNFLRYIRNGIIYDFAAVRTAGLPLMLARKSSVEDDVYKAVWRVM